MEFEVNFNLIRIYKRSICRSNTVIKEKYAGNLIFLNNNYVCLPKNEKFFYYTILILTAGSGGGNCGAGSDGWGGEGVCLSDSIVTSTRQLIIWKF